MRLKVAVLSLLIGINSLAQSEQEKPVMNSQQQEIYNLEKQFEKMVKTDGMSKAFLHFAAEDAVLNRNDVLIKGKKQIANYFAQSSVKDSDVSLTWEAEHVDVSASGDMAYTYGPYQLVLKSDPDNPKTGVFHTVWKRQADGNWKFVWD